MAQNAERLKSIEKMTIEQYLEKYDKYIRGLIYKRADADYRDDAYQEVVMQIINYKDKLDSLETDAQRCAYICQIAKHTALPSKRANKKLKTYGDFTTSDDDDATDPEEWFLEDNTYCPDNQPDFAKRAWAEEIIDTNEQIKQIEKCLRKIKRNYYMGTLWEIINRGKRKLQKAEWAKQNPERMRQYRKKYYEIHREEINKCKRQKRKEKRNEQLGHIK